MKQDWNNILDPSLAKDVQLSFLWISLQKCKKLKVGSFSVAIYSVSWSQWRSILNCLKACCKIKLELLPYLKYNLYQADISSSMCLFLTELLLLTRPTKYNQTRKILFAALTLCWVVFIAFFPFEKLLLKVLWRSLKVVSVYKSPLQSSLLLWLLCFLSDFLGTTSTAGHFLQKIVFYKIDICKYLDTRTFAQMYLYFHVISLFKWLG